MSVNKHGLFGMCIYVDRCERTGVYRCIIYFLGKKSYFSGIRK